MLMMPPVTSKLTRCIGFRWSFLPHLLHCVVRSERPRADLHRVSESAAGPEWHRHYRASGSQLRCPLCRRAQPLHMSCCVDGVDRLPVVYRHHPTRTIRVDCFLQPGNGWYSVTWPRSVGSREIRCTEARDFDWHGVFRDCLWCPHRASSFGSLGKRGKLAQRTGLRGDLHDGRSGSSGCCARGEEETRFNGCVGKAVNGGGFGTWLLNVFGSYHRHGD